MSSPLVHLLYGLVGSGKSTLARSLVDERRAVRFTLDEWMLRLDPDLSIHSPAYGVKAEAVSTTLEEATERAVARSAEGTNYAHDVSRGANEHLATLMQEPSADEGLEIIEH